MKARLLSINFVHPCRNKHNMSDTRHTIFQFIRYVFTGLVLNLLGYLIYLAVTWYGMEPKMALTVFYPLGVLYSYFAHKRFSFQHSSGTRNYRLLVRYITVYAVGYMINLSLLSLFSDRLGYPHHWVQGAAIFIVAWYLFVALKLFVFRKAVDLKVVTS